MAPGSNIRNWKMKPISPLIITANHDDFFIRSFISFKNYQVPPITQDSIFPVPATCCHCSNLGQYGNMCKLNFCLTDITVIYNIDFLGLTHYISRTYSPHIYISKINVGRYGGHQVRPPLGGPCDLKWYKIGRTKVCWSAVTSGDISATQYCR